MHPQMTAKRAPSLVELLTLFPVLAAAMTAVVGFVWHLEGSPVRGNPARIGATVVLSVLLLIARSIHYRLRALARRRVLSPYLPVEMRVTLDEDAFVHLCGSSSCLRGLALLCTHLGPVLWIGLAFELGEFCAVVERPLTRWRSIGTRWDFSLGTEESLPPEVVRKVEREVLLELCGVMLLSVVGAAVLV